MDNLKVLYVLLACLSPIVALIMSLSTKLENMTKAERFIDTILGLGL